MTKTITTFLKEHWFKISLLAILIIGLFNFMAYLKTNASLAERKFLETKEKEKREYIAKRRNDCYDIYERERKKWNNVEGIEYDEERDVCRVSYKDTKGTWQGKNCQDFLPKNETNPSLSRFMEQRYFNCITKTFTEEF